jgi:hypothetical protein
VFVDKARQQGGKILEGSQALSPLQQRHQPAPAHGGQQQQRLGSTDIAGKYHVQAP